MAKRRGYITGFKERLDEAVYASGYTKAQLAKMCGFDRKVLMSEGSGMNLVYLARLGKVLKVSVDYLLYGDGRELEYNPYRFWDRLYGAMDQAGMGIEDLAEKAGVGTATLQGNTRRMRSDTLRKVCTALGVEPGYLLYGRTDQEEMKGKEAGDTRKEQIRLEDKQEVKEYQELLRNSTLGSQAVQPMAVIHELDRFDRHLGMAQEELRYIKRKAAPLMADMPKLSRYLATAGEELGRSGDALEQVKAVVLAGIRECTGAGKHVSEGKLKKPFSVAEAEKRLLEAADRLKDAYAAIDKSLGEAEHGCRMPDDRAGYLPDALREAGRIIRMGNEAAFDAAHRIDALRPKGHKIIKHHVLAEGLFRKEEEKQPLSYAADRDRKELLLPAGEVRMVAESSSYQTAPGQGKSLMQKLELCQKKADTVNRLAGKEDRKRPERAAR